MPALFVRRSFLFGFFYFLIACSTVISHWSIWMRLECDHFFARAQIKQNQCCTWKCHKMWRLRMWLCLPCKFSARTEAFRFCKQGLMGCSHVPWPPNKNKSHLSLWEFSFKKHYSCQWESRGIRITFSFSVCQTLTKWPLNYLKWQEILYGLKNLQMNNG